jgi:hypothetical protein
MHATTPIPIGRSIGEEGADGDMHFGHTEGNKACNCIPMENHIVIQEAQKRFLRRARTAIAGCGRTQEHLGSYRHRTVELDGCAWVDDDAI